MIKKKHIPEFFSGENMRIETLQDLLAKMKRLNNLEALRYNNGYRTFTYTYKDLYRLSAGVAEYLTQTGLRPGDKIVLWGENRPEWVILFWAAVSRGIVVVPMDTGVSQNFVQDIINRTGAKLLFHGDRVNADNFNLKTNSFECIQSLPAREEFDFAPVTPETTVEIVFTSGSTGRPKGMEHTHANVCSNLRPFIPEFERHKKYLFLFRPLRLLNLLPFSHMFGQALGMFIPVLLDASTLLSREMNPSSLSGLIKKEKASVLITVPGHLNRLGRYVDSKLDCSMRSVRYSGIAGAIERILRFRDVHSFFGWWFWAIVVGGAQLPTREEHWWKKMGFPVIQGYGLTEASPIVSLNHPFNTKSGSLGKALAGQEVRMAPDGEILVRGPNIVSGYLGTEDYGSSGRNAQYRDGNGWFHTGDIGEMDAEGRLYFKGRKKETIVTPEGQNVYPEDVENVLKRIGDMEDCAVVGINRQGQEEVHAVLLNPAAQDAEKIIREANSQLQAHQSIRNWSVWPGEDFPRTSSTGKIKRSRIKEIIEQNPHGTQKKEPQDTAGGRDLLLQLLAETAEVEKSRISEDSGLSREIGLSSLQKIELLSKLEEHYAIEGDEQSFLALETVGDLRQWLSENKEQLSFRTGAPLHFSAYQGKEGKQSGEKRDRETYLQEPRWNIRQPVPLLRNLIQGVAIVPFFSLYLGMGTKGRDNLHSLEPPFILAANHTSHLDVAAILCALPGRYRRSLAPSMAREHFHPLVYPEKYSIFTRSWYRLQYFLVCFLLNAFPLPQTTAGTRRALRYAGELAEKGYSTLIFPEGERSPNGEMQSFQPGVGLLAKQLDLPVLPIRIKGLYSLFSKHGKIPRPGRVQVCFLPALRPSPGEGESSLTFRVEESIRGN